MDIEKKLIRAAIAARKKAYAPYSGYTVGAAALAEDGRLYSGCNIENASYPAGICGERTAIFKAVSEGNRRITALALAAGKEGRPPEGYPTPCGICRQVMAEFGGAEMEVILVKSEDDWEKHTLGELLPLSFTAGNM